MDVCYGSGRNSRTSSEAAASEAPCSPLPPSRPSPFYPKQDGCLPTALRELEGKRRALIVTDKTLMDMGFVGKVTSVLHDMHMQYHVFFLVRGSLNGKAAASCTVACTARPPDTAVFSFRCAPDL